MFCFEIYSNKLFTNIKNKGRITDKLYMLSKIHKSLSECPGRLMISNCGTSKGKVSEFFG